MLSSSRFNAIRRQYQIDRTWLAVADAAATFAEIAAVAIFLCIIAFKLTESPQQITSGFGNARIVDDRTSNLQQPFAQPSAAVVEAIVSTTKENR